LGELRDVEAQLLAFPSHVSEHWLWFGNIKRAGYMMEQVAEMLEGTQHGDEAADRKPGDWSIALQLTDQA